MMPTGETILADFIGDLTAYEAASPRALQTETGASQVYGCIAEALYRLRGTEGTERLSWPAVGGKALHAYIAEARAKVRDDIICEQRFVYKNVPASVDCLLPTQHGLIDYKSKGDVDDIDDLLTDGPSLTQLGQIHLGAAAANEAGYDIRWVALLVVPRSGEVDDIQVLGPWEFDPELAEEAARWSADVDTLAADPDVDPRDYRGKPAFWCYAYCPFVSECRGDREDVDLTELAPVVEAYREALDTRDTAIDTAKQLRPLIPIGTKGLAGRAQVSYSPGGTGKDVAEEDTEALRDLWRFVNGEELPTRVVTKPGSSPRLVVKWKDKP